MRKIYLLLAALALTTFGYGQVSYLTNYFTDAGNPGGINTEADASGLGSWTNIITGPQAANVWSPVVSIPFPFEFFGQPVTHLKASQNGLVTFDTAATALPNANGNLPDPNLPDLTICGMWDEFTASAPTGTGDDIRTNVFGTAPNRQFWIRWYSFEMGNPTASFNYFSVVLEETSNKIFMVDQYSTASPLLTPTIGVQLDASTAVQFGTGNAPNSGNGSANTDNDYFEFCPFLLVNDNAALTSFTSPVAPASSGANAVDVVVTNNGQNTINSLMVGWSINGTAQTPVSYSTPIASFGTAGVSLGSGTLAHGDTICAWTFMPNGNADSDPSDDTLCIVFCAGLSGVYSIGGATPDYNSLWEAGMALADCGVLGPVEFQVAPGTYQDSLLLGPVPGMDATNNVVFNGMDRDLVTVTNSDGGQNAIVWFKAGNHFTIKNMTLQHFGTTDAWGVLLQDSSSWNLVDSCRFTMLPNSGTDVIAVVASGSDTDDFVEGDNARYCTFSNNIITGGDYAFHFEGLGTDYTVFMPGMQVLNNDISGYNLYGVYMDNMDSIVVRGNRFRDPVNTGADGIYCFDIMNFDFSYNDIVVPDYGIYVSDGNFDGPPSGISTVINNMSLSTTDYACYLDDVNDVNIIHNTFNGNPGMRIGGFFNLDIRNNIFYSETDYAYESDESSNMEIVENNLYYTSANSSVYVKDGAGIHADLNAWQTAEPALNSASVEARPFFTAPDDLHLIGFNGNDAGDPGVGIMDDIDGDMRPLAPSTVPDIGADEYAPLSNDAVFLSYFGLTDYACGDSMTMVMVVIENQGDSLSSLPVTVEVTGATTATLTTTYPGPLAFGERDTIVVGMVNTYAGGTVNFDGYTQLAGEQDLSDDSLSATYTFVPFVPVAVNDTVCEGDTATLTGDMTYPVGYVFYDSAVGGTQVGYGNYVVPGVTTPSTYYMEYANDADSILTTFAAGNGCGGGNMFDVSTTGQTVLRGFAVHNSGTVGSLIDVTVWYIEGASHVGNETNPTAWTNAGTYTVPTAGVNQPTDVMLNSPIPIMANTTYAIYVEYDARYTNGTGTYTNGFMTVQMGVGLCNSFGGTNQGREFNGIVYYGSEACSNVRVPVTASSVPAPMVDLGPDSTLCDGDSLVLDPGFASGNFAWSTGDSTPTISVSAANDYSLVYTNSIGCVGMDTMTVATEATPSANFTFLQNGGAGLGYDFTDQSTGNITSWSWDFGDGSGTSTMQNPSYTYGAGGTYVVTLVVGNTCGFDTITFATNPVGVEAGWAQNLEVYPNPTRELSTVRLSGLSGSELQLELYTMQGQVVRSFRVAVNGGRAEAELNVADLAAGAYFLRVQGEDGQATRRITVE